MITNDKNGYLIENRDFEKMADKVIELIDDYDERVKLGKYSREFSLNYTLEKVKDDWLQLLKRRD